MSALEAKLMKESFAMKIGVSIFKTLEEICDD